MPEIAERPRDVPLGPVLIVQAHEAGPGRYRCNHLCEQLEIAGVPWRICNHLEPQDFWVEAVFARTIILQRVPYSSSIDFLIQCANIAGSVVAFETDDLTFDPDSVSAITHLAGPDEYTRRCFIENSIAQRESLIHCKFLLTSTEPIAASAQTIAPIRAFVHRNGFSGEMKTLADQAMMLPRVPAGNGQDLHSPVYLGYFSGTPTHDADFAVLESCLRTVLTKYPAVRLRLVGPVKIDSRFERDFAAQIDRHPAVDWRKLPELIAGVAINLAPLESNNVFCDAKSEVKYLEAGLVAVPTVATPISAFRHAIRSGENGFLASTTEDWLLALSQLIEQPDLRARIGQKAREHVLHDYSPEARSASLVTLLESMHRELSLSSHSFSERAGVREYVTQLIEYNRRWISARDITRRAAELWWERLCEFPGRLVRKLLPPR